jgi:hypothetical protein
LLADVAAGDDFTERIVDAGGSPDYTVEKQEDSPILDIEASATTPTQAVETVSAIIDALSAELSARQERLGVPDDDRIVTEVVVPPRRATQLDTERNRALTVVIAFGVAAVIGASVAAESIARGRARSRRAIAAADSTSRATPVREMPLDQRDLAPPTDPLVPPDPRTLAESNGDPAKPAPQQRR